MMEKEGGEAGDLYAEVGVDDVSQVAREAMTLMAN
jgi:hypothetical protein